jgi:hypothetical protein
VGSTAATSKSMPRRGAPTGIAKPRGRSVLSSVWRGRPAVNPHWENHQVYVGGQPVLPVRILRTCSALW